MTTTIPSRTIATVLLGAALLLGTTANSPVLQAAADPAWETTHQEVAVIKVLDKKEGGALNNFCVNTDGNLLACCRTAGTGGQIKVLSPAGQLVETWALDAAPQAICVDAAGTIYVGGSGRISKLDQKGKVVTSVAAPGINGPAELPKDMEAAIRKSLQNQPADKVDETLAKYKVMLQRGQGEINGIALTDQDVFITCKAPSDYSYVVYRFDRELQNPKLIIKGLAGCCGQMDVQAHDGKVWIPHNARHKVECYDREGKLLLTFGKYDRQAAEGFGGCCEPKNLRLTSTGDIFAAESAEPISIKHFSPEGKFLGVVALPHYKTGCVRVTVDMSKDGKQFYIMDPGGNAIHVLGPKG